MTTETEKMSQKDGTSSKKSLLTGTKNTQASFYLSSEEICRIIEKCGESGVESLELQDQIRIKFHSRRNENAAQPSKASDYDKNIPVVSEISTEAEKEQMDLMDQEAIAEAEEAQVLIDNASEFERLQIARHIERARMSDEKAHA